MPTEQMTLYKLMVLYMLKKVNFPLSNSQMSEFFQGKEYTNYFTFQQALSDLLESNLIKKETVRNSTRYEITGEGEEVFSFFGNKVSEGIISDIDTFLKENKFKFRSEVGVTADYRRNPGSGFTVECLVKEGKETLIRLELTVLTEEQAITMCDRWSAENQKVYEYIMKNLIM